MIEMLGHPICTLKRTKRRALRLYLHLQMTLLQPVGRRLACPAIFSSTEASKKWFRG